MEQKPQLFTDLKDLTNQLNQTILRIQYEDLNKENTFDEVKTLNQKVSDLIAILDFLKKKENPEAKKEEILAVTNTFETSANKDPQEEEEEEEEVDELKASEPVNIILEQSVSNDEVLGDKFMSKGISDINAAIGISEKFLFIHELFNGNTEQYINALQNLNSCKSEAEATKILSDLCNKLNWNEESSAFLTLKNIIGRKHPA